MIKIIDKFIMFCYNFSNNQATTKKSNIARVFYSEAREGERALNIRYMKDAFRAIIFKRG